MIRYMGAPNWKPAKIEDLIYFQRGFDITKAEQKEGDVPVISSSGIKSFHSQYKVKGPGVVIGRKGTLGSVYYSECDYWPHDTTLWSKDFKGNNPKYVYYALKLIRFERFDAGAANPTLNRNHIHGLPITIPRPKIQNEIVSILDKYDDLIENNKRRIELLEDSAQQLYKEWFVRFRFPGHEHVKIIDGVPEGWKRLRVKEAVKRVPAGKRYSQKTALRDGTVPILDQGQSGILGYHNEKPSVDASYLSPIIVFANHTCYQRIIHFPFSSIQNVLPFVPSENVPNEIYWLHYATLGLVTLNGYKGHWPEFESKLLISPPRTLAKSFSQFVKPIHHQIRKLEEQNNAVSKARDLLLPKLMNGEIAV